MKGIWKRLCYGAVEEHHDEKREGEMAALSSLTRYCRVKDWTERDEEMAGMQGEIGKLGMLVPERYLDHNKERLGCYLKLLCRSECLPTLARVCKERRDVQKIPTGVGLARCRMCNSGDIEDTEHIVLHCAAYATQREWMYKTAAEAGRVWGIGHFAVAPACDKLDLLMGRSTGSAESDDNIDHAFKRFLKRAWRSRAGLTRAVNLAFDRNDVIDKADAPTKLVSVQEARRVTAVANKRSGGTYAPRVRNGSGAPRCAAPPMNSIGASVRRRLAL
jgi:hypothetical protein